jgi:hypothetical protein
VITRSLGALRARRGRGRLVPGSGRAPEPTPSETRTPTAPRAVRHGPHITVVWHEKHLSSREKRADRAKPATQARRRTRDAAHPRESSTQQPRALRARRGAGRFGAGLRPGARTHAERNSDSHRSPGSTRPTPHHRGSARKAPPGEPCRSCRTTTAGTPAEPRRCPEPIRYWCGGWARRYAIL